MTRNLSSRSDVRLRGMLCVFLFIAAGVAVLFATGIGEREIFSLCFRHVGSHGPAKSRRG